MASKDGSDNESADCIASACLTAYNALPPKGAKPTIRSDGKWEWTISAGIVLCLAEPAKSPSYHCISLASGVKALPYDFLTASGDVLHDSHAEILARRAARLWLLSRLVAEHAAGEGEKEINGIPMVFCRTSSISASEGGPIWKIRENVSLHLYCSTLPCGDASVSLLLDRRKALEKQAFLSPSHGEREKTSYASQTHTIRGRSLLEVNKFHLRTKPGRPQSLPSIAMSCTDKICLWSICGFQGSLLSRWVEPIRLTSIVVSDQAICTNKNPLHWGIEDRRLASQACSQIFSQKVQSSLQLLKERDGDFWETQQLTPAVEFTRLPFSHSRESVEAQMLSVRPDARVEGPSDEIDIVPAPGSVIYSPCMRSENLVEGRKQGSSAKRRQGEPLRQSSRSPLCKLDWYRTIVAAESQLVDPWLRLPVSSYFDAKRWTKVKGIERYRFLKTVIQGNDRLQKESSWREEMVVDFLKKAREEGGTTSASAGNGETEQVDRNALSISDDNFTQDAPFSAWLVSGRKFEEFDLEGKVGES